MGYGMLSRAKFADQVWVMNPFVPHLFAQGPPHGPHVLMKKLRGEISADEVTTEFEKIASAQTTPSKKPDATMTLYRCAQCFLIGKPDDMKPAAAFGVAAPQEISLKILADGAWTRCLSCREEANLARRRAGLPDIHADSLQLQQKRVKKIQACNVRNVG